MTTAITGHEDIIDSRDIIARIEELEELESLEELDSLQAEELEELRQFADACEGYGDWEHGETLIAEGHFVSYIEELIDDCYEMPKDMKSGQWPYRHLTLDYEAAAEEAKADYTEADLFGNTFLMRA